MVSQNRSTSVPPQTHKPIRYTPHQVAAMAMLANEFSPDFVKAITSMPGICPYLTQAFLARVIENMVEAESPRVLPCFATYFGLKQNRTGGFTWTAR